MCRRISQEAELPLATNHYSHRTVVGAGLVVRKAGEGRTNGLDWVRHLRRRHPTLRGSHEFPADPLQDAVEAPNSEFLNNELDVTMQKKLHEGLS